MQFLNLKLSVSVVECGILDWNLFSIVKDCESFSALTMIELAAAAISSFAHALLHTRRHAEMDIHMFFIFTSVIQTPPTPERTEFLNPPAEEKSIAFRWPLEKIAEASHLSSLHSYIVPGR